MVSTGKVFPYTVKFYTINEDQSITDIASTQYNLMQDGRYMCDACVTWGMFPSVYSIVTLHWLGLVFLFLEVEQFT